MLQMFHILRITSILKRAQCNFGIQRLDTYYDILRVPKDASKKDIRLAFLKLSKQMHPDMNYKGDKASHDEFIKINEAYNVLSKDYLRQQYDTNLRYSNNPYKSTFRPSNETVYYYKDSMWHDLRYQKFHQKKNEFSDERFYRNANDIRITQNKIVLLCLLVFFIGSFIQAITILNGSARLREQSLRDTQKYCAEYNLIRSRAISLDDSDALDIFKDRLLNDVRNNDKKEER